MAAREPSCFRVYADEAGSNVNFDKEARTRYLIFTLSPEALWRANFRDLGGSVTRMVAFAAGGRIDETIVAEEITRLRRQWTPGDDDDDAALLRAMLGDEALGALDKFDQIQLTGTIRRCRQYSCVSAAGRALFSASTRKSCVSNDADRLRKYLARFGLRWEEIAGK